MSLNSPLSNFLSTMKNSSLSGSFVFRINSSKMIGSILNILKLSGYVIAYEIDENDKRFFIVKTNSFCRNLDIEIMSKPSRRFYLSCFEIKRFLRKNEFKTFVVSTSCGIISSSEAIKKGIGGEVLFSIC